MFQRERLNETLETACQWTWLSRAILGQSLALLLLNTGLCRKPHHRSQYSMLELRGQLCSPGGKEQSSTGDRSDPCLGLC